MKNQTLCLSCDDGFSAQSTDKSELRDVLKLHLKKHHSDMKLSKSEVEEHIAPCK